MPTIEVVREIDASADAVFALGQDYGRRLEWDPFLREIELLGGATDIAVGVEVRVKARHHLTMVARYTTVTAPTHVAIAMVTGPAFFASFSGAWTFRAVGPRRCRAMFRYHFTLAPSVGGRLLCPAVAFVLRREMTRRLVALKAVAEVA